MWCSCRIRKISDIPPVGSLVLFKSSLVLTQIFACTLEPTFNTIVVKVRLAVIKKQDFAGKNLERIIRSKYGSSVFHPTIDS